MPEQYYANADKDKLVPGDDPSAAYVVNPNSPGEFDELLKKQGSKVEGDEREPALIADDEPAAKMRAGAPATKARLVPNETK